jgi:hypothetical protein
MPSLTCIKEDAEETEEIMPAPLTEQNGNNSNKKSSNSSCGMIPPRKQVLIRQSSLLPVFTQEQMDDSAAVAANPGRRGEHQLEVFGIPYQLFCTLVVLAVIVTVGTVTAFHIF